MLSATTPLILTINEAANIGRMLDKLEWAATVIVLDSFSTDDIEHIARSFPNVVFLQR
jgi:glycosyltransferase involved in cell wall biosynthesis